MSPCYKTLKKLPTIYQNENKIPVKVASSGFSFKERLVILTVDKVIKHNFWQNW